MSDPLHNQICHPCNSCHKTFKSKYDLELHFVQAHVLRNTSAPSNSRDSKERRFRITDGTAVGAGKDTSPYNTNATGASSNSQPNATTKVGSSSSKCAGVASSIGKQWKCPICGVGMKQKSSVNVHVAEVHKCAEKKPLRCSKCGAGYKSNSQYTTHKRLCQGSGAKGTNFSTSHH